MHQPGFFIGAILMVVLFVKRVTTETADVSFAAMSKQGVHQSRIIQLRSNLPSKELACAMLCADDPGCEAHHYDQGTADCHLVTRFLHANSTVNDEVFVKIIDTKRTFKTATTPENELQLTCNQLALFLNVTLNTCINVAESLSSSKPNALTYDENNQKCSLQQCPSNNDLRTTIDLTANTTIMFNDAFYPTNRTFKTATTPENKLRLTCNQLALFVNVTLNTCINVAESLSSSKPNALTYDETNSKCSLQQCPSNNDIRTTIDLTENTTIMFEASFYPRTCAGRILVTDQALAAPSCPSPTLLRTSQISTCRATMSRAKPT